MPAILVSNIENFSFVITFGCVAIIYNLIFLILGVIFILRKTELNYSFGYRSWFSLSSTNRWKWCNKIFFNFTVEKNHNFLERFAIMPLPEEIMPCLAQDAHIYPCHIQ